MNLYEINQEILNAINNLEVDENGEILSTSKLDELQEMFETKCENIACYIKNIKADIDALKAEEKKLQDLQPRERQCRSENQTSLRSITALSGGQCSKIQNF